MILKIAGSIAVLTACSGFGFYYGSELERRIRELNELRSIFLLIRGDIRYLKTSLPEAFDAAAVRSPGTFEAFFRRISDSLSECVMESFQEAFIKAAGETLGNTALKQQDILLLNQLGGMFGRMDTDMQLNALDWYLEQLEETIKALTKDAARKVTLSKSLGILGGIFLLVILL